MDLATERKTLSMLDLIDAALGDELLLHSRGVPAAAVKGLAYDSRQVRRGYMFVALPGTRVHGIEYVADAVANGASVVVTDRQIELPDGVGVVLVSDAAAALARLSRHYYGLDKLFEDKKLQLIGITGTNGKTTVSYYVQQVLNQQGFTCGRVGTVDYHLGPADYLCATHTTPQSLELAGYLRAIFDNGGRYAAMEVSSHALDQGRVWGLDFAAAVFTNLGGDHLDYHGHMERYLQAKCLLFRGLGEHAWAVVNADDARARQVLKAARHCRQITYSLEGTDADIHASELSITDRGGRFCLHAGGRCHQIRLALLGRHNVANALAAAGACMALGVPVEQIVSGLESLACVPGRLEQIHHHGRFQVVVDYAHTDDALKNVLAALREVARGTVTVVFGCGGDRDRSKRPRMARVAGQLADKVIVTSDNPRTEKPEAIIDEILVGFEGDISNVTVCVDRREAIHKAVREAEDNEVILIAGKGHEDYQIVGDRKLPFDDRREARQALAERGLL